MIDVVKSDTDFHPKIPKISKGDVIYLDGRKLRITWERRMPYGKVYCKGELIDER